MLGTTLGILGGLLELGLWSVWFWLLIRVRIPRERRPVIAAHGVGLALGVTSLALGADSLGSAFAAVAIVGGASFLGLAAQSRQAPLKPAVALGGPILEFTLPDHQGRPFDLDSLRGKPFLLKFFRGHW